MYLLNYFSVLSAHFFAAFGDICFKHSISLNTICAPPPQVGNTSACNIQGYKNMILRSNAETELTLYNLVSSSPSTFCSCERRQYLEDLATKSFGFVSFRMIRLWDCVRGCKIVPVGTIPVGRWFIHLSAFCTRWYLGFTTGIWINIHVKISLHIHISTEEA